MILSCQNKCTHCVDFRQIQFQANWFLIRILKQSSVILHYVLICTASIYMSSIFCFVAARSPYKHPLTLQLTAWCDGAYLMALFKIITLRRCLTEPMYKTSQKLCTRLVLCRILLWFDTRDPFLLTWFNINSLAPGGFENIFQNVFFKLISWIDTLSNSCETALRSMPQNPSDDKSTLVQVMAWCRQAASHYLSQCCPKSLSPYGVTRPQWVKPRKDRISNYIHYKVWDEITYPLPIFNAATVEVWEWIRNFIPHFIRSVVTYPSWD